MDEGLRERKKRQTREAISQVATRLFYARGFDAVTVSEVARAADVSKMTVFNYFARKEELLFDREPEGLALLRAALANRGKRAPLTALRDEVRRLVATQSVFVQFHPGVLRFYELCTESVALRARTRELADEVCALLAPELGELVASLVVAGWRAACRAGIDAARRGLSGRQCTAAFERVIDATYAAATAAARSESASAKPAPATAPPPKRRVTKR